MTELLLRLHGSLFALRGPHEALGQIGMLYHESSIESEAQPPEGVDLAASYELERDGDIWRLAENGSPAGTFDEPVHALLGIEHAIEERLLARLEECVVFHAGAVEIDGGALLLAGTADRGKSSSTFQLVELGHAFVAEELAAVDVDGQVRPHLQSISLDPRVVQELSREHPPSRGRFDGIGHLLTRYSPTRVALEPVPLHTIALPAYRPGEPATLEELTVESVLTELLGYCFEPPGDQEPAIDRVIEIASAARLLRIGYPDAPTARSILFDTFGPGP